MKTKILLLTITLLTISFVGTVNARESSLYLSPSTLTKNTGDTFSVSAGVSVSGDKVCAVEGTLVFNNLSCQSITMADGVMAQSSPTCSNPYFLIGIPSCTTTSKPLLTVSVKAGSAGTASVGTTGVDVMGEGSSLSTIPANGSYTIITPVRIPVVMPKPTTPTTVREPVAQPTEEVVIQENQSEEVVTSQPEEIPTAPVVADNPEVSRSQASLLTVMSNVLSFGTGNGWLMAISILVLLAVIGYGIAYFLKKKRRIT